MVRETGIYIVNLCKGLTTFDLLQCSLLLIFMFLCKLL